MDFRAAFVVWIGVWTANTTHAAAWSMSGIPTRMAAPVMKQKEASLGVNVLLISAGVKISFPAFLLVLFRNTHPLPAQTN